MKKQFILAILASATITAYAQPGKTKAPVKPKAAATPKLLKTAKDSISYAFGISLGQYLKSQDVTSINYLLLNKAVEQCLKEQKTILDFQGANEVISGLAGKKAQKAIGIEKGKGKIFLTENKKRTTVKETASGLQYEIIKEGTGMKPTIGDTISAHYAGTLLNGTEFDNSYKRGEPLKIPVGGVIPGWTEALQLMPVGSKWKLFIPSDIAYGDMGAGHDIPGGATLIFEIELLDIVNKKTQ